MEKSDTKNPNNNMCERILHADLSGYYVFTNQALKKSALVQLRRMGDAPAYLVSAFRFRVPSEGIRKMVAEREAAGWLVQDPMFPDRRATVMNLEQTGQEIAARFEDSGDTTGFYYLAKPEAVPRAIHGDILRPDRIDFRFYHGIDYGFRMTRLDLDQAFDSTVSHFLKSVLAGRLGASASAPDDLMIVVDLKSPMTVAEAAALFETEFIFPFEDLGNKDAHLKIEKFSRYVVPKNLYEFLESSLQWIRHWEVAQIDAIPTRLLNPEFVKRVVEVGLSLEKNRRPTVEPTWARQTLSGLAPNPSAAAALTKDKDPPQQVPAGKPDARADSDSRQ